MKKKSVKPVCLFGWSQRPRQLLGHIADGPQDNCTCCHTWDSWETMTSVSAGHIILTPTQPVGSGQPQRESNPGPPHQESRALPIELPRPQSVKQVFYPFKHVNFSTGKYRKFLSKCWKMPLFALQLSKFSGEACPQTPLEKLRPWWLLCPSLRKILLFHKISLEALIELPCMLPVV